MVTQAETPTNLHGGVRQVVGRLGWGIVDQAVSSLSNFALGIFVARSFSASSFGAFALAFITYTVFVNAARGIATDPLMVRFSGASRATLSAASASAAGTALLVGTVSGAGCVLVGLFLPEPLGPVYLALGLGLPGLMLQDSWRFSFFAGGRAVSALVNDALWSLLLLLALTGLHLSGRGSVVGCLLVFGATASVAAVIGTVQAGILPRPAGALGWLREHHHLSMRYLAENVTASGAAQIRSFALGAVTGLAAVGYVRGAEMLMGPFLVVLMGICQVAVPEASRVFRGTPTRLAHFCLVLGGAQAATALAWAVALLLILPLGPGQLLLKDLWPDVSPLIPAVSLNVIATCFLTAAITGLRGMAVPGRSLRTQLAASAAYLVCGIAGAVWWGAVGTCWGVFLGNSLGALVGWYQLRAALRQHRVTDGRVGDVS